MSEKISFQIPDETIKKLAGFMEYHSEARYPEEQMKFYQKCTKDFTKEKMQEIKEVFSWLKKRL